MPPTRSAGSNSGASDRLLRTPLHYAAAEAKPKCVAQLLAEGSEASPQDKDGWTPLHFAAQSRSKEVVKLLLDAGAVVDIQDNYGNTALFRAVFGYSGDGSVIELLRQAGANPKSKNSYGVSPVGLARSIVNTDVARHFIDITELE